MSLRRNFVIAVALVAASACTDVGDDGSTVDTGQTHDELDAIGLAKQPASLLVLDARADDAQRTRLARALDRIGGGVVESLPPRLVIAQVPDGADSILRDLGVVARFDRAITGADLGAASIDEDRFAAVYSNRWFPGQVPPQTRLAPKKAIRPAGEAFESSPLAAPPHRTRFAVAPEDQIAVPYASGTIVISIVLPESNGVGEPSTEDWTEDQIRDTYLKVQAAIDNLAQAEPNSHLRFVVHYESRPDHGGLAGTVDSDLEFGKHAQWNNWQDESTATAAVLAKILGHAVDPNDVYNAALEYDAQLKAQYHADGAYFVMVAADGNYTAGLRAHAYIYGPWTVLDSSYGWDTFNHEFGHIFGAMDEYCPDACVPTTAQQGYLGMTNGNATYQIGGDGINNGQGEDQPSLMNYNVAQAINGYTRASWGWLDVDGDGVIDVRDTFPRSTLSISVVGNTVHATGVIADQPAPRFAGPRYSMNTIDALEYRVGDDAGAPWFRVQLAADTRGQQAIDLDLCDLPAGGQSLWLRAINSAGNVEVAQRVALYVDGTANPAPRARLVLDHAIASTSGSVLAHAVAQDDTAGLQYRFDTDGDGVFETAWSASSDVSFAPRAGLSHPAVQVRDAAGSITTATAELDGFDKDAAPAIDVSAIPSVVFGSRNFAFAAKANAVDPEGDAVEYRWLVDDATNNFDRHTATDWSPSAAFATTLETPSGLAATPLDLTAGDATLGPADVRQVLKLDNNTLAVAGGWRGLWIVDITKRAAPVVLAKLDLETTAQRMFRDGNRLWVLGSLLTVVDIHDYRAPVEIKQLLPAKASRVLSDPNAQDMIENQSTWSELYDQFGAKITDTKIEVTIDHPRPADLRITLYPPKQFGLAPVTLWDHKSALGGLKTLKFNEGTTPGLKALEGKFASENWGIEIIDDNANGQTGRLVSTKITFATSSYAVPVLDDASRVLVAGGKLVVAGDGIETFDASFAQLVMPLAIVKGTPCFDAFVQSGRVVWMGPLEAKSKSGTITTPPIRGLAVIDLTFPMLPIVVRTATDVGGDAMEIAKVGTRVYVRVQPTSGCTGKGCGAGDPFTVVGNASSLANGAYKWQLGTTPFRFDPMAFGDDKAVWAIGARGWVMHYDVSNAGAIALAAEFPRSMGSGLISTGTNEAFLWQWGPAGQMLQLDQVTSTVSRVYRVTLEARDGAGMVSRVGRTVHVIPYDHAPSITGASITQGITTADQWIFHVSADDPDYGTTWDPQVLVRADWDGDGSWDSDWFPIGQNKTGEKAADLYADFPVAGHYDVVFQVRDGFWASSTYVFPIDVRALVR